jgi:SnoaL-like domain
MDISNAADTFTLMLQAIDAKDWEGVRAAFAERVHIDDSSLFGAPAAIVSARDQVNGWHAFARHFDATQHLTGPFVVTAGGQDAVARTHVRACHRMTGLPGGDVWMVAGHYEVRLRQIAGVWKIAGITLTVFYQEGNLSIPEVARSRA